MNLTRYIEVAVLMGLIMVFGTAAHQRNFVWKDDFTLWSDVVEKSPDKARPHTCLGLEYQRRSLTDRAIFQYEKSISLEPRDADAHNNLGLCYFDKGWIGRAIEQFKHAFKTGLTIDNIKAAIVAFEESLLTPDSRFDLYLKNTPDTLTTEELEGYNLFKQYGCISCHQGVAIGGNLYQRFGVMGNYFADRGNITATDLGRYRVTQNEQDKYVFKVPSLRNVSLTAP